MVLDERPRPKGSIVLKITIAVLVGVLIWVTYEPYAYMEEEAAYKLAVDDSSTVKKYLLEDPDGYGSIGSVTDDQKVNKASWEE